MDKKQALEKLITECKECRKCVLRQNCTQVVPGEGNPDAEIMFIGEGPGQKEDELGRPFVGAAGKLLTEMINMIGLKREDVYIANIVKCRPPGNRDPLPEEAEACWPWLKKQIEIIQPKLIALLGKHSLEKFLPGKKISEVHGKALRREIPELGKFVFLALYHPAAALYQNSLKEVLFKDFKKIPKVLELIRKNEKEKNSISIEDLPEKQFTEEEKQDSLF